MKTAIMIFMIAMLLNFIGMAVAMVFDKSRLINFFFLACVTFGVLAFVLMVLIDCLN